MTSIRTRVRSAARCAAVGVAAVVVGLVAVIGTPDPAAASCAGPPTVEGELARADLAFVGTVTELTNAGRWATFTVDDLWKGDLDSPTVDVHAGPADPGGGVISASSVDRTYDLGVRYLVFAYNPTSHGYLPTWGDSGFEDNNCSGTQPYSSSLDAFRPADAHRVAAPQSPPSSTGAAPAATVPAPGSGSDDSSIVWIASASAVAVVAAIAFALKMKGRRAAASPA